VFDRRHPLSNDVVLALIVRLLAVVAGIFMLRGHNWARWLAIVWIAFHVVMSAFHSVPSAAFHALLLAVLAYFLFRRQSTAYFRVRQPESSGERLQRIDSECGNAEPHS
jgi:uncharacterized membrane protein